MVRNDGIYTIFFYGPRKMTFLVENVQYPPFFLNMTLLSRKIRPISQLGLLSETWGPRGELYLLYSTTVYVAWTPLFDYFQVLWVADWISPIRLSKVWSNPLSYFSFVFRSSTRLQNSSSWCLYPFFEPLSVKQKEADRLTQRERSEIRFKKSDRLCCMYVCMYARRTQVWRLPSRLSAVNEDGEGSRVVLTT